MSYGHNTRSLNTAACGLYFKLHHKPRPVTLSGTQIKKRNRKVTKAAAPAAAPAGAAGEGATVQNMVLSGM